MNKRIFRGISLTALVVLLLSMVIIFGALYGYFDNLQASRLRTETALAAQGVRLSGRAYFENLEPGDYRLTWVAEDGRVLADTESDPTTMENHASRQEIAQALKNGYGESRRYSDTRMDKTLYYALQSEGIVQGLFHAGIPIPAWKRPCTMPSDWRTAAWCGCPWPPARC